MKGMKIIKNFLLIFHLKNASKYFYTKPNERNLETSSFWLKHALILTYKLYNEFEFLSNKIT